MMTIERHSALLDVALDAALDGDLRAFIRIQQRLLAEAGPDYQEQLKSWLQNDPNCVDKLAELIVKTDHVMTVGKQLHSHLSSKGQMYEMVSGHA